jgi:hypothetical protein
MERRVLLGLLVAGLLVGYTPAAEDNQADPHAGHFDHCAKACAECMRECESCAHHCAHMVADGKKDHMETLGTCTDCAEICAAAAKVTSHHGPLAVTVCESCAKACDQCGAACEKFPDDEHMSRCAKSCRDCAKACRQMVEHAGHDTGK